MWTQKSWRWRFLAVVLAATGLISCGSDGGDKPTICSDSDCLTAALSTAESGNSIHLEAGTYEGSFSLPAGVILAGSGPETTTLKLLGAGPALEVTANGAGTVIDRLGLEGGLDVGGTGELSISDLSISVTCGAGIVVRDLTSLTARNIQLTGNVTEEDAPIIPAVPDKERHALVGLAAIRVGHAELRDISARGFASIGVLLYETQTNWKGGEVTGLVGSGILAAGSADVTLEGIQARDIWGGATPFGYGIVAAGGSHLVVRDMNVEDNEVAGVLMDGATGQIVDSTVTGNGTRGIWIQHCQSGSAEEPAVVVDAVNFEDNRGVSFGVFESAGVLLENGDLLRTQKISMIPLGSETRTVEIGDAIEIIGSNHLAFANLSLTDNSRAGVVIDGRGGEQTQIQVDFVNVRIDGQGERGFVLQNATATSTPDVVSVTLQQADIEGSALDVANDLSAINLPEPHRIVDIDN